MRRWLILIHRWLGIVLSLFFVVWFASGIVMVFTGGMPELSEAERLAHLPALDFSRVRLRPIDAVIRSGRRTGGRLLLLTIAGRPAYRIAGGRSITIFADTGERLNEGLEDDQAVAVAAAFMQLPPARLHHAGVLDDPDQWTIELRQQLPLHKITADDPARTELYVAEQTADVALVTTRQSRSLAWAGAIPHWLYLRALRVRGEWWRRAVLWSSGLGIVSATIGIVLAFTQYRVRYAGWMKWHYWTGALFGIFTVTWVFSGWLSMEPWDWTSARARGPQIGQAVSGVLNLSRYPTFDPAAWTEALAGSGVTAKEIEFRSVLDVPYYVVRGSKTLMLSADGLQVRQQPFDHEAVLARIREGSGSTEIEAADVLSEYDSYYYDQHRIAPLPALRVKFADPDATWAYVDLTFGQLRASFTRRERVNRWLYHGLHDLDFAFWFYNPPVWYAAVVVLCLGGTALSVIGVVIGWRRLRRTF